MDEHELDPDPMHQFAAWYAEAKAAGLPQPDAIALATATEEGHPSVRMVLLKGHDGAASPSTRTTRAVRRRSWQRIPGPRSSSTGSRSIGRCESKAPSSESPTRSRPPTSRRGPAAARSRPGRHPSRAWSASRADLDASVREDGGAVRRRRRSRRRRSGAATGSSLRRSSSGRGAGIGSTTASATSLISGSVWARARLAP